MRREPHSFICRLPAAAGLAAALLLAAQPARALSEIQKEELPPVSGQSDAAPTDPAVSPPAERSPESPPSGPPATATQPAGEDAPAEDAPATQLPASDPNEPLPEIIYDASRLPEPVARMRNLVLEAARSGKVEALRPLLGAGDDMTQLSFGGVEGDPVEFLKSLSGDGEGHEILAILQELLEAGYVHLDPGTPEELYVWPYFFAVPMDRLDDRQKVELYTIVTGGEVEDFKAFGAYNFFRIGITPEGRWAFFVAGD